jgi:RNA polymerase sigma factor (sigma-70 family)
VQSDTELVKACLNGNKEVFAVLVKRYERAARAVALNVLGDYHITQDAVQDSFLRAYEKLPNLRKRSAFGPWLMKITQRRAIDICQNYKGVPLEAAAGQVIENVDGRLDEQSRRLLAAVLKLPKAEKHVVMLRYFTGHSVKDVAEISGRSVGTVTKQLSRAHKRLRNILERSKL